MNCEINFAAMIYSLLKPLFFSFGPETAHQYTVALLEFILRIPGGEWIVKKLFCYENKKLKKEIAGINFNNPVGLAAGFDKDAKHLYALSCIGFGFIEVGTVTPLPQPGNDKPRLFRLPKDNALINRMGFNNQGVDVMVSRIVSYRKRVKDAIIIGGNIGKNKITPNEAAINDYVYCFQKLFDVVDYFVVNVSSPNTPGLRELQEKEPLKNLLAKLQQLNAGHTKSKPLFLKIAPDLTNSQLDDIVEIVIETKIAGVVATNTTIKREGLSYSPNEIENFGAGGLSGKPVRKMSTEVIAYLKSKSRNQFAIIGAGGIHSPQDALEKIEAGADLIQVYTGMIYEGPALMKAINMFLSKKTIQ